MAMWFAHVAFAEEICARLGLGSALGELAWGAVCCDVDKVSPVPRDTSHFGTGEGLHFAPERFVETAGLSREVARESRYFLAGYLSHLAVDEAWYGYLGRLLRTDADGARGLDVLVPGWNRDSTRAWNLALDLELRARVSLGPDGLAIGGEGVLPFLREPAPILAFAGRSWLAWSGDLEVDPADPLLAGFVARFRAIQRSEAERVGPLLERTDRPELFGEVAEFSTEVVRRFLADLG